MIPAEDEFEELPEHEPAWAALDRITAYRRRLLAAGYQPLPVNGKKVQLEGWPHIAATNAMIGKWAQELPDHLNTGVLTGRTPALDIDVADEDAAEQLEALAESMLGKSAVRIGRAPKRAILFRTDTPFAKLLAKFVAPNGDSHQIEVLGDGQQVVINGIHPDTGQPYRWHGGEPGPDLKRDDLPLLTAEMATEFLAAVTKLMAARGWKPDDGRKGNGADTGTGTGTETKPGIRGRSYATAALDNLVDELAATKEPGRNTRLYKSAFRLGTMAARGWLTREEIEAALYDAAMACGLVNDDGEAQTRRSIESGLADGAATPHPDLPDEAPVQAAVKPEEPLPRQSLADVHAVFKKWLGDEYDLDAASAAIAAAASERLPGDPLWLLIVAGPGGAKTETCQALAGAGAHVTSTIASEGALLSATPRRERNKKATGGLLRKICQRGVLVIKDVTSILSADRNIRGGVLAALREVYDGLWERNVGTDGGQTLTWTGRIVVVGAVTTAWDAAHGVVATMGDRFVLLRPKTGSGRQKAGRGAIRNTGGEKAMRQELATAVGGLVSHMNTATHQLSDTEIDQLLKAADIVTMARSAVERDYRGEIVFAHDPEMPTRFAKQLVQLLRGAIAIGMIPADAMRLVLRCARDSIPPLRRDILLDLADNPDTRVAEVRKRISKPRNTVRRELECLHMLGLLRCDETEHTGSDGKVLTIWRYRLADDYDKQTLRRMAENQAAG